jgi:hypothetical protein
LQAILAKPAAQSTPSPIINRYSLNGLSGELLVKAITKITMPIIKISGAKIQNVLFIFRNCMVNQLAQVDLDSRVKLAGFENCQSGTN